MRLVMKYNSMLDVRSSVFRKLKHKIEHSFLKCKKNLWNMDMKLAKFP